MKVLIIEDDLYLRNDLSELLAEEDYEVLEAIDEQATENVLTERGNEIAIAIVDMVLPAKSEDLDIIESGFRIIQLMTAKYPEIVSIVLTGHETFDNAMKCIEEGASYYLVKGNIAVLVLNIVKRAAKTWMVKSANKRIYNILPDLVKHLDKIDLQSEGIRELYGRVQQELNDIEEEHYV